MNKITIKKYQLTTGEDKYSQLYYYSEMNLSSDVTKYGTPISAMPINSASNSGIGAYFFDNNSLRVLSTIPNASVIVRVTYSK